MRRSRSATSSARTAHHFFSPLQCTARISRGGGTRTLTRSPRASPDVGGRLEPADDVEFESAIPYDTSWGPLAGFVTVVRPAPLADQVTTPTCDGDLATHEVYCYDLADGVYTLKAGGESVLLRAVEGELYWEARPFDSGDVIELVGRGAAPDPADAWPADLPRRRRRHRHRVCDLVIELPLASCHNGYRSTHRPTIPFRPRWRATGSAAASRCSTVARVVATSPLPGESIYRHLAPPLRRDGGRAATVKVKLVKPLTGQVITGTADELEGGLVTGSRLVAGTRGGRRRPRAATRRYQDALLRAGPARHAGRDAAPRGGRPDGDPDRQRTPDRQARQAHPDRRARQAPSARAARRRSWARSSARSRARRSRAS